MQISKVIMHRQDSDITTFVYGSNNTLRFVVTDNLDTPNIESIFISKITRINANNSAFIQYTDNDIGFINLPKKANYQNGSALITQLTWHGDDSKQAKLRSEYTLVGKYIIYQGTSDKCQIINKSTDNEFTNTLQNKLNHLTGKWVIRSAGKSSHLEKICLEADKLANITKHIIEISNSSSSVQQIHIGTANYLRVLRELNLTDNCEITTNDSSINQELSELQDIWEIDAITYNPHLNITYELASYQKYYEQNIFTTKNDIKIEYGVVAGIHIFDINSNNSKLSNAQINNTCLDEIYLQITLRNLYGIILIDIIKDSGKTEETKLINKLTTLFKNDISYTKVLGITNGGLLELVRNKY